MPAFEDLLQPGDFQKIKGMPLEEGIKKTGLKKHIAGKPKKDFKDRADYETYKKVQLNAQAQKLIDAIMENQKQKNLIPQPPQNLEELRPANSEKKIIKKRNENQNSDKETTGAIKGEGWTAEDEKALAEIMNEITQLTQRMKIQEELAQLKAELARIEKEEDDTLKAL